MKPMESDWYRKVWTLDIQNQSWVEDTGRQVDFIIRKLGLRGGERVLGSCLRLWSPFSGAGETRLCGNRC